MRIERIYREILYKILELKKKDESFKQSGLSKLCGLSISTVNYALKPLVNMKMIEKKQFGFRVIAPKKLLIYWASRRKLSREVVYQTFLNEKIEKIEGLIPTNAILTAYSAFKIKFKQLPSEYSEVVVYGKWEDFEKRFGKENRKMKPNLIVLELDEHLLKFKIAPIAQIYVDLWNLGTWYAEEFRRKLEEKIDGLLE